MPTYEYRCKACEHAFERVQSMTAPVKRKCPACGKLQLERLIGVGAGFIIKGGAASTKAEAAEKAADQKARKKTAEAKADAESKPDTSGPDAAVKGSSENDTAAKKEADTKPVDPPEKKISGATSTPTHAAREGRGVGNLVDKAKRRSKEAAGKKPKTRKRRPSV